MLTKFKLLKVQRRIKLSSCFGNFQQFSTANSKETSELNNNTKLPLLNDYLQNNINSFSKTGLQSLQMNIVESINKDSTISMIMCDDFNGRKYSCALGVINRLLKGNVPDKDIIYNEDFFANAKEVYKQTKAKSINNAEKGNLKPRGALIICEKFDFATNYFRICRKLDKDNKLRMIRVGTSLQSISPSVELDAKTIPERELGKLESALASFNLINTTEWKNLDILFITPQMLKMLFSHKDSFDYFDINPEIILIDDFDYMINSKSIDIKSILKRFFSTDSKFTNKYFNNRKLIFTSSTVSANNLLPSGSSNHQENVSKSVEFYKNYIYNINSDLLPKIDIVMSKHFMDLNFHLKDIKVFLKQFDVEGKALFDKKIKYLLTSLHHEKGKTVICCSESSINSLKEALRKKKFKFVYLNNVETICVRLFSTLIFNTHSTDILLISPSFLKSLNFPKVNKIVLFDWVAENKDFIRIVSKFPKISNQESLHLLYTQAEIKENNIINYLKLQEKNIKS